MAHKLNRAGIEGMLRRAGVRGGVSGLPSLIAMRMGMQRVPAELDRLASALKRTDICLEITFRAVDSATGEQIERFDLEIK